MGGSPRGQNVGSGGGGVQGIGRGGGALTYGESTRMPNPSPNPDPTGPIQRGPRTTGSKGSPPPSTRTSHIDFPWAHALRADEQVRHA